MAYGQVQRTINVATAGTLSEQISEDEKYQIEELTLSGELNGDDIYLIRDMAGINMDNMSDYKYLGKRCFTDGKLRVLDLSDARIVEGGRDYFREKVGSVSFVNSYTKTDEISGGMFAFCYKLEEVVLPKSAKVIYSWLFHGEAIDKPEMNIKVVKVADGNPNYDSRDNCNAVIGSVTNTFVVGAANSIIPDGVTTISNYAFYGCSGLTSITIPNSVAKIGMYAFSGCDGLQSVTVDLREPLILENGVFSNYNATLYVPKRSKEAYAAADYWKEFKEIVEDETLKGAPFRVGDTFTADGVTYKVTSIDPMEVQVGDGIAAIDKSIEGAYEIPATVTGADENVYSVTAIGGSAFSGFHDMTSVTIPNSVTSIVGGIDHSGYFFGGAFENCGLTTLTIPSSVTSIGDGAFAGCSDLVSIVVEEGNTVYDSRDNCNAIIEKDDMHLIAGCKNTIFPDGVIGIGGGAFMGCIGLTSLDIPNSVTYISDYAFWYCNGLTSLNISENVTYIGALAFAYCSGLTTITIPENVKTIWYDAFRSCSGLVSASILPKSMNRFGLHNYSGRYVGIFGGCENLTTVIVGAEEPLDIGGKVLDNSANATLYVPKGSKAAYEAADYWKDFKEIVEFSLGDADGDGIVDQKDVDVVSKYIMNGNAEGLNLINATGSDKKVLNVADIVRIINIMRSK